MLPSDLVGRRVRPDPALEVDVVALLDVARVQGLAKGQRGARSVWEKKNFYTSSFGNYTGIVP